MTVKKLSDAQKKAVVTIYTSNIKPKSIAQLAELLNVSTRTIGRVIEEAGVTASKKLHGLDEASRVMRLLYKHKVSVEMLEEILGDVTGGQLQYTSGLPVTYQTRRSRKSPKSHNGKQSLLPLNLPTSLELH